jgi:hypothetical protein
MLYHPTTGWSAPISLDPIGAGGMLQVRGTGDVYVFWSIDEETPASPKEGLRMRDGETHLFGYLPGQAVRLRKGEGTAYAEVFIGPWLLPA